jgi:hypothetical protein
VLETSGWLFPVMIAVSGSLVAGALAAWVVGPVLRPAVQRSVSAGSRAFLLAAGMVRRGWGACSRLVRSRR